VSEYRIVVDATAGLGKVFSMAKSISGMGRRPGACPFPRVSEIGDGN
jgi:hypothetical protein